MLFFVRAATSLPQTLKTSDWMEELPLKEHDIAFKATDIFVVKFSFTYRQCSLDIMRGAELKVDSI